jgi:hypothetical protein
MLAEKETERQEYVDVEFMEKDILFKIPEFQSFFKQLETSGMTKEVLEIVGGNPNRIKRLVNACNGKADIEEIVVDFLFSSLQDAQKALAAEIKICKDMKDVFESFRKIPQTSLIPVITFPGVFFSEVKCLRVVHNYLVPSNPTISFALHTGLEKLNLNFEN